MSYIHPKDSEETMKRRAIYDSKALELVETLSEEQKEIFFELDELQGDVQLGIQTDGIRFGFELLSTLYRKFTLKP